MARRGGSIYVSTDPNVVLAIGTPGQGISIGPLGPTIYGGSGETPPGDGPTFLGLGMLIFAPSTVQVVWEF